MNKEKLLNLMTSLFQNGLALDIIDISGKRNDYNISQENKFLYDAADAAFNRVDIDLLYNNAESLHIPEKYPEFFAYLCDLQIRREEDGRDERNSEDVDDSDIVIDEEPCDNDEKKLSTKDKVLREIAGGHHTGNERDSEKYVKQDEYRMMLTDEYLSKNEKDKYIQDSFQEAGQDLSHSHDDNIQQDNIDITFNHKKEESDENNVIFGDEHIVRSENYNSHHNNASRKNGADAVNHSLKSEKDESKPTKYHATEKYIGRNDEKSIKSSFIPAKGKNSKSVEAYENSNHVISNVELDLEDRTVKDASRVEDHAYNDEIQHKQTNDIHAVEVSKDKSFVQSSYEQTGQKVIYANEKECDEKSLSDDVTKGIDVKDVHKRKNQSSEEAKFDYGLEKDTGQRFDSSTKRNIGSNFSESLGRDNQDASASAALSKTSGSGKKKLGPKSTIKPIDNNHDYVTKNSQTNEVKDKSFVQSSYEQAGQQIIESPKDNSSHEYVDSYAKTAEHKLELNVESEDNVYNTVLHRKTNQIEDKHTVETSKDKSFVQSSYEQAGQKPIENHKNNESVNSSSGHKSINSTTVKLESSIEQKFYQHPGVPKSDERRIDIIPNKYKAESHTNDAHKNVNNDEVSKDFKKNVVLESNEHIFSDVFKDNNMAKQLTSGDDNSLTSTIALSAAYMASKIQKDKDTLKNVKNDIEDAIIAVSKTKKKDAIDISNQYVIDSYYGSTLSSYNIDNITKTFNEDEQENILLKENVVDIGLYGISKNESVFLLVNGRINQYEKLSNDTVLINGNHMNIHNIGNNIIFVGWTNVPVSEGKAVLPSGEVLDVTNDGHIISTSQKHFSELMAYNNFMSKQYEKHIRKIINITSNHYSTDDNDKSKYVTDSYTNATLSSLYGYTFGSEMQVNRSTTQDKNSVDIGTYGKLNGNVVSLLVNGNVKQYEKRPDDTIIVEGKLMDVYNIEDGSVFIGWRDIPLVKGKATLPTGDTLVFDSDGNIKEASGYYKEIKAYKNFLPQKKSHFYLTCAPTVLNNPLTESNFIQNVDLYTPSITQIDYAFGKNVEDLLDKWDISRTIEKQGFLMQLIVGEESLKEMYENVKLSNADVNVIVSNYDKIIALNGVTAYRACKINSVFEEKYLSEEERNHLNNLRKILKEKKLTENANTLKSMLKSGELSKEEAVIANQYIEYYDSTRKKIVKEGILSFNNEKTLNSNVCAERGFYASSMIILLSEKGLPTDINELKEKIKNDKLDDDKKAVAENALKILRANKLADKAHNMMTASILTSAKKIKNTVNSAYRNVKQFMSRYMGEDYTTRGLLMLVATVEAPIKAVRTSIRAYRLGKLTAKLVSSTGKTAISGMKLGYAGAKAVSRTARFVYTHGARNSARAVAKRLKGIKVSRKSVVRKAGLAIKKTTKSFVKFIVRILQLLTTSLISIIGPMVFFLILALIIVFMIFSFVKNSGDTVYYDAGDEDTSEVVQEMVDLLTLCHASFRDGLTNQFGGGVSSSATGANGSAMNAPQLKKGESSPVKGLYDVLPSTWANWEFGYPYPKMAAGTKQRELQDKITSGQIKARNNGGMLFLDEKMYAAAFTTYWGNVGDVIKVEFEGSMAIGDQPSSNTMFIVVTDIKNFAHTGYPEQKDGLYGHPLGGHRDFAEFFWWQGATRPQLNGSSLGSPLKATNMGNILDGTCDMSTIGTSGTGGGSNVNADILYRQEIDQDVYREIINREKNIYYTFPKDQEVPDGITPTPTPKAKKGDNKSGEIYGFYNNNQEIISMALAMFDFDINSSTSAKRTILSTSDESGANSGKADTAQLRGITDKINDDTWKLITYFDENGLNFDNTKYKEGGYDDLRYSAVVGLFNASHIVTGTPVLEYHEGPDGTINPIYNESGRIIGQNNTDGMSYQVPVIVTDYKNIVNDDGTISVIPYTHYKTDADGEIVYETKYAPCPGHRKMSAAVITLHFDSLLNIKKWWKENIYNVDDFNKENPNYSSKNKNDENYNAKKTVLKRQFQYIKKPDFYKPVSGTCEQGSAGSSGFSPGTMTESQIEVARTVYAYLTGTTMNLTKEQAIGVLVNIKRECDFNYTLVEAGSGAGYGLCQWTGGRRDKLIQWCNAHPQDGAYNTLKGQLSYLNAEFTVHADVWTGNGVAGFRQCSTERAAGEYFIRYFERPQAEYLYQRIAEMDSDIATVKSYLNLV